MKNRRLLLVAGVGTIVGTQLAMPNAAYGFNLICNGNGTACVLDEGLCESGPNGYYYDSECKACFGPTSFYYIGSCQNGGDCPTPDYTFITCSF